jgi:hypothetical protein
MYGPPPDCKGKVVGRSTVCTNVSGLWLEIFSPGHNDDPRVLVLINPTVIATIFRLRFSGTPFDCSFVLFSPQQTSVNFLVAVAAVDKWEARFSLSKRSVLSTAGFKPERKPPHVGRLLP